jgi:hypothetical protein
VLSEERATGHKQTGSNEGDGCGGGPHVSCAGAGWQTRKS